MKIFVKSEGAIRAVAGLTDYPLLTGSYGYLSRLITGSIEHDQQVVVALFDAGIDIDRDFSDTVIKSPVMKISMPLRSLLTRHIRVNADVMGNGSIICSCSEGRLSIFVIALLRQSVR
ncbi:hypothetical protein [Erwinia pyrifoliae]|uniref:hypothetical protein n=1 Tax=Erwinia pyrifoliae TaxID=79967 RepID=UPI00223ADB25|nr:hypothetical protein [Erwinia pyrifoliae]MCT2386854.1 hypothetical protein [Erwinia pyrifoliae]MCU8587547.1 hypothetical protein [Erwinia pyrifoliae]